MIYLAGTATTLGEAARAFLEALNDVYADYPEAYAALQRTVHLPTTADAEALARTVSEVLEEAALLQDEAYLAQCLGEAPAGETVAPELQTREEGGSER